MREYLYLYIVFVLKQRKSYLIYYLQCWTKNKYSFKQHNKLCDGRIWLNVNLFSWNIDKLHLNPQIIVERKLYWLLPQWRKWIELTELIWRVYLTMKGIQESFEFISFAILQWNQRAGEVYWGPHLKLNVAVTIYAKMFNSVGSAYFNKGLS